MEKFAYFFMSTADCPALDYDLSLDMDIFDFACQNTEFRPLVEKCLLEADQRRHEDRPLEAVNLMDLEDIPLVSNNPSTTTFHGLEPEARCKTCTAKNEERDLTGLEEVSIVEKIESAAEILSPEDVFDSPEGWYVVDISEATEHLQ